MERSHQPILPISKHLFLTTPQTSLFSQILSPALLLTKYKSVAVLLSKHFHDSMSARPSFPEMTSQWSALAIGLLPIPAQGVVGIAPQQDVSLRTKTTAMEMVGVSSTATASICFRNPGVLSASAVKHIAFVVGICDCLKQLPTRAASVKHREPS